MQVSPQELEYLLLSHPDIEDAAVIALPEVGEGEVPKAFVVKAKSGLTDDDVISFVSERVATYKRLHGGVEFISKIPKSYSGKILRRLLQERELGKLMNEYGDDDSDEEFEESVIETNTLQHHGKLLTKEKSNVIIKPQESGRKSNVSREKPKQFDNQQKSEIRTEKVDTVCENPIESTNSTDSKRSVKHVNENHETPNQSQIVPTAQSTVIKSSRSCVLL